MSSVPTRTTCVKKQQLQAKAMNLARLWFFLANLFISSMCLKKTHELEDIDVPRLVLVDFTQNQR